MSRSVLTAPTYAYGVFRALWEESGGTIGGDMRIGRLPESRPEDGSMPATLSTDDVTPFVRMKSPPLVEEARWRPRVFRPERRTGRSLRRVTRPWRGF